MSDKQCFVCGFDNDHALERHHIIPESLDGADTEQNTEWLCANCHRAISTMYSKWFFAKIWRKFEKMDNPPKLVRQNPPMGLEYNGEHELVPSDKSVVNEVLKGLELLDEGKTYREITSRTSLSMGKVQDLRKHEELYRQYEEECRSLNEGLSHYTNGSE